MKAYESMKPYKEAAWAWEYSLAARQFDRFRRGCYITTVVAEDGTRSERAFEDPGDAMEYLDSRPEPWRRCAREWLMLQIDRSLWPQFQAAMQQHA